MRKLLALSVGIILAGCATTAQVPKSLTGKWAIEGCGPQTNVCEFDIGRELSKDHWETTVVDTEDGTVYKGELDLVEGNRYSMKIEGSEDYIDFFLINDDLRINKPTNLDGIYKKVK